MKSSRLHRMVSIPVTAVIAIAIVARLIFLTFSRTKTVSINAASATAISSPEVTRALTSAVCSGKSPRSQRKRQLVSRLGITLQDMGFPAITSGCAYRVGSLLGHFFLQELSYIRNSAIIVRRNSLGWRKGKYYRPRWYFAGNINCQPSVGGYVYRLRDSHTLNIA